MKGRLAVMTKFSADFDIREYTVPEVEPDAALVRITRGGICGSDLHIWRGELQDLIGAPDRGQTFGHEMCGVIERLGKNVTTDSTGAPLKEGDRVTYCYFYPCGRCPACLDGHRAACPNKRRGTRYADDPPHFVGSYGEYFYLRPGHFVYRVPDSISDDVATPVNCALAQVLYGLDARARPGRGHGRPPGGGRARAQRRRRRQGDGRRATSSSSIRSRSGSSSPGGSAPTTR